MEILSFSIRVRIPCQGRITSSAVHGRTGGHGGPWREIPINAWGGNLTRFELTE